jgi:hypothetical protein
VVIDDCDGRAMALDCRERVGAGSSLGDDVDATLGEVPRDAGDDRRVIVGDHASQALGEHREMVPGAATKGIPRTGARGLAQRRRPDHPDGGR